MRVMTGLLAGALVFCCPVGPAFAQAAAHLAEQSDVHSHDGVEHSHEHEADHHGPVEICCAEAEFVAAPGPIIAQLKILGVLPSGVAPAIALTAETSTTGAGPPLFVPRLLLSRASSGRAPPA